MKTTVQLRALRRLRSEDTKRIISLEMHPKKVLGTFEKQTPGPFRLYLLLLALKNCDDHSPSLRSSSHACRYSCFQDSKQGSYLDDDGESELEAAASDISHESSAHCSKTVAEGNEEIIVTKVQKIGKHHTDGKAKC